MANKNDVAKSSELIVLKNTTVIDGSTPIFEPKKEDPDILNLMEKSQIQTGIIRRGSIHFFLTVYFSR